MPHQGELATPEADAAYLKLVVDPIRVCAHYKPKFGKGIKGGGLTLPEFQTLYRGDVFYSWLGLDNPYMYAAHKAAGGMTSVYRQIGIGCEKLFRTILKDSLGLSAEDVLWSYGLPLASGKARMLHLDGRVPFAKIADRERRVWFRRWMRACAEQLEVSAKVFNSWTGTVFEVRQGYKSKDSKRQNADIANASSAYRQGYLPCAVLFSTQIDSDVLLRYRSQGWAVLTGMATPASPLESTYSFMREVVGYDLAAFFERNRAALRSEIDSVLKALLAPITT